MLFIGHEQLLQHHVAWSQTCRVLYRITNSDVLWLGRLVALHAAVQSHRGATAAAGAPGVSVFPVLIDLDVYKSLVSLHQTEADRNQREEYAAAVNRIHWNWKRCFLHFFFGCVSQRCMVCCCPPSAVNQPTSHFSWRRRSSRGISASSGDTVSSTTTISHHQQGGGVAAADGAVTAAELATFPFEGCCVCSICLRKFCWLASMPQGKIDAKRGQRFYGVNRGRWVVCVRSDVRDVIAMDGGEHGEAPDSSGGGSKRSRASSSSGSSPQRPPLARASSGYRLGGSSHVAVINADHDDDDDDTSAPSHFSVRHFVARAQQASHQKYISPSYRAHEPPKDPMGFLSWPGHTVALAQST
jgi:hypothetical protein